MLLKQAKLFLFNCDSNKKLDSAKSSYLGKAIRFPGIDVPLGELVFGDSENPGSGNDKDTRINDNLFKLEKHISFIC